MADPHDSLETVTAQDDWWRGAVIYQIYPRSFNDSSGNGVGDLRGIIEKLAYVADLGVDGIWLSPFFQSPMADFGYDVSDHCAVDPLFGSLADFDELVLQAHSLGLKVIIDQVYSHTSIEHPWFQISRSDRSNPKADWYVWAEPKADGTPPNNWLSVFGGSAWTWDARRRQYYLHNFLAEQPDLNFHNAEVQRAVLNIARFWLDRGVDGFRLDVANYYYHDTELRDNPPSGVVGNVRPSQFQQHLYERSRPENLSFLKQLRSLVDMYSGIMTVAEIDSTSPIVRSIEYTEGPGRFHTAYNFSLLRAAHLTPELLRTTLLPYQSTNAWPSWSVSNHDVVRAMSRWGAADDGEALAKQIVALLLSIRGTAFLYQGDELGLPQAKLAFDELQDPEGKRFWPEDLGRDGARTPMPWDSNGQHAGFTSAAEPWLPVVDVHKEHCVDLQQTKPESMLSFTKRFLSLRKKYHALQAGDVSFIELPDPLLAFTRTTPDQALLAIFNLSDHGVEVENHRLPEVREHIDIGFGCSQQAGKLIIPARGVFLGQLKSSSYK